MPFFIQQRPREEQLGIESGSTHWVIRATTVGETMLNARAALASVSSLSMGAHLVRRDIQLTAENDSAVFKGLWSAVVTYGKIDTPVQGDTIEWSGSIGGGTKKIRQFLEVKQTVRATGASGFLCAFGGAINVSNKGEVEGVDIVASNTTFNATMKVPVSKFTMAYLNTLAILADGVTNNGIYLGFAPGELLFMGADFSQLNQEFYRFTYKFHAAPNRRDLTIGEFTGLNVGGHEYIWFWYDQIEDLSAMRVRPGPTLANVGRVYTSDDYTKLGFGP